MKRLLLAALVLGISTVAFAAEHPEPATSAADHSSTGGSHATPSIALPEHATWAGVMILIVGGMFVAAAVIGPIVRSELPEEVPPAHSHDEPPGASHHHGLGGTLNPDDDHTSHGH